MSIREQVRVDGVPLNMVAPWGDLTYSYSWPGGCDEASFGVYLPATSRRWRLRKGAKVEIFDGSTRIWWGLLGQPDWREGSFTADGLSKRAGAFTALDGAGNSTSRADVAVDTAIAAGAGWAGRTGVPATPATNTSTTDGANTVATVLDAVADEAGQRWGVFADGQVLMAADATTPMWRLAPGLVDLGQDDTDYASRLRIRYINTATGTYTTLTPAPEDTAASAAYGGVTEATIDLTGYGPITSAKATAIGNGILAKSRARLGWTNALEVGRYELTTMGGLPADLSRVRANHVVRAMGVWDELAQKPYRDLVLGRVTYTPGSGVATLEPVDTQPQTLEDVTAAVTRKALARGLRG